MTTQRLSILGVAIIIVLHALPASAEELGEVVVTAQKRAESVQDVPISIAAVSGEVLAVNKIDNIFSLQSVVPALQVQAVDPPGQGTAFALRGLGNSVFNMGFDPAVATFVDGVYRSRSGLVGATDFVDLERVEVLKGPQGTLFGKNTTAGVVHMISRKPTFDGVNGMVELGYGEYSRKTVKGMINLPASDHLAFRLSGSYAKGDGWMKLIGSSNRLHDLDRWSVKGQMLFKPSEDFDVHVIADYARLSEHCCWAMRLVNDPNTVAANGALATAAGSGIVDSPNLDGHTAESNFGPNFDAKDWGVMAEVNWNLGGAKLTSITAHRRYEDSAAKDNDFSGVDVLRSNQNLPKVELTSEEARLAGDAGRVDWMIGGYYSKEEIELTNEFIWGSQVGSLVPFLVPGRAFLHTFDQDIKSAALFGHLELKATDRLKFSLGARWSEDKKDGSMVSDQPPGAFLPYAALPLAVVYDYNTSIKNSKPTFTGSAQYEFTDRVMAYATYSRGYKSGGISMTRDAAGSALFFASASGCPAGSTAIPASPFCAGTKQDPTFKPEEADHLEAGIKSDLLDRHLRLNAAVWYTKFKDLQYQTLRAADGAFAVVNIEGATSKGAELEVNWAAAEGLRLDASVQYLDATFGDGVPALTPGNPALGGQRLPYSSKWTGNLGVNYEHGISGDWKFQVNGNAFFRTEYFNASEPAPTLVQGGYTLYNLRAGVANKSWDFSVWCRNCGDKMYTYSNFALPFDGTVLGASTRWAHVAEPRMYGVTAAYRF